MVNCKLEAQPENQYDMELGKYHQGRRPIKANVTERSERRKTGAKLYSSRILRVQVNQ